MLFLNCTKCVVDVLTNFLCFVGQCPISIKRILWKMIYHLVKHILKEYNTIVNYILQSQLYNSLKIKKNLIYNIFF